MFPSAAKGAAHLAPAAAGGVSQFVSQIIPSVCGPGAPTSAPPRQIVTDLLPGLWREEEGRPGAHDGPEERARGEDGYVLPVRLGVRFGRERSAIETARGADRPFGFDG